LRTPDGRSVMFVADPAAAPADGRWIYARPDDASDDGKSWREVLLEYNSRADNPLGLLPAFQLYENSTYSLLVERFGIERVFVLSAGWGLIRSDFLTPDYDITFTNQAERYARRRPRDEYRDFRMLPEDTAEQVIFLGGKDYVPLFSTLTALIKVPRLVFYNSEREPHIPGCEKRRFLTKTRTNWHYECAGAILRGDIRLD